MAADQEKNTCSSVIHLYNNVFFFHISLQSITILKKKILPELINNEMEQSDNISSYTD